MSTSASDLSIEQQARLTSGRDFWTTKPEGDAPSIMLTDGPHGLRKQLGATDNLGLAGAIPATCFPPAVGLAQTWNPELATRLGAAIAVEAKAAEVGVVLGPGINLKRSPLGGRNFEYFSEDPLLTAHLATAWINGVQSGGVGTSLKHFAANNQETDRMRVSADIDARTLHEMYLRAFRYVVRQAQPWTVMCSYNRINGVHAFADRTLLTGLLRDAWEFDGLVVSDWGAVDDRVAAVAAGMDLTMPFAGDHEDDLVVTAINDGSLDRDALATSAQRVLDLVDRASAAAHHTAEGAGFDAAAHHALAREAAGQSIVLLRNDAVNGAPLLPLDPATSVLVVGELARTPRYQGGGSSHVNATQVDLPVDRISGRASADVTFEPGYTLGEPDHTLADAATSAASTTDTVVLVLGLGERQESEGFDRTSIALPDDQVTLAQRIVEANPNTVIVLCHGGIVDTTPLTAPALVDAALLGQAVGSAITDVLYGDINPSGRLAETVPRRLSDTGSYLHFPGEHAHVLYGEGIFVGYRWYDARDLDVAFPFGHGLSYTTFTYSDLVLTATDTGLRVELTVTNSGDRDGREVVQVYVGKPDSSVSRAPRELRGFTSVSLARGESATATINITADDLAYWDTRVDEYVTEAGTYEVSVGASSRDLRVHGTIDLEGNGPRIPLSVKSSLAEVLADPVAAAGFAPIFSHMMAGSTGDSPEQTDSGMGMDLLAIMGSIPVERLAILSNGQLPLAVIRGIIDQANTAADQSELP